MGIRAHHLVSGCLGIGNTTEQFGKSSHCPVENAVDRHQQKVDFHDGVIFGERQGHLVVVVTFTSTFWRMHTPKILLLKIKKCCIDPPFE